MTTDTMITRESLLTLEAYARERSAFRVTSRSRIGR